MKISLIRRQHRRLHTGLQMPLERMLRMLLSTIPMEHAGIMVRRPVVLGTAINGGVDEYCEKLRNTMASNVTIFW